MIPPKKKHTIIYAIDPDVNKSGICQLNTDTKKFAIGSYSFTDLIDLMDSLRYSKDRNQILIRIECSWDEKGIDGEGSHNHHITYRDSRAKSSKIGYETGRNHQTGKLLYEIAKHYKLDVELVKPLNKKQFHWTGEDGKASQKDLQKFFPDFPRSNQDARDAFLLAWIYSGFSLDRDRQVLAQILNKK